MKNVIYKIAISGIISDGIKKLIEKGFEEQGNENLTLNLFCLYSEFDIPVGAIFNYFEDGKNLIRLQEDAKLIAVTQQLGKPFAAIPSGWKTISKFQFSERDVNTVKTQMPIVESWFGSNDIFYLLEME